MNRVVHAVRLQAREVQRQMARPDLVVLGHESMMWLRTMPVGPELHVDLRGHKVYIDGMRVIESHDVPEDYVGVFTSATRR